MLCISKFNEIYKNEPSGISFCPYRVCPIGAHSDHQHGKVTGFAIDKGIHIAYGPKLNGVIEIKSLQFEKRAQWHIADVPKHKQNDWADYLRGATIALKQKYTLSVGLCGVIEGSLPIGGLSSSAAVIIAFINALCKVNNITLTKEELISVAFVAETEYVGLSIGKLDQSCEVYSQKDALLYLDTQDDSYEIIPASKNTKPYKIAVFFSGVERNLIGSKYNMRVDECRSVAYALKAYEGMEYGKLNETYLRDVPYEIYLKHKDKLPCNWVLRADHYYSEYERVEKGVEAWRNGDLETFGRLSSESGKSSIENWQTGSEQLKALYDITTKLDGVWGGRFSGAGFKGCSMAIIDPSFEESIIKKATEEYIKIFPELKDKFEVFICESANGVSL